MRKDTEVWKISVLAEEQDYDEADWEYAYGYEFKQRFAVFQFLWNEGQSLDERDQDYAEAVSDNVDVVIDERSFCEDDQKSRGQRNEIQ